jgi:alpha-tubulin suppressor-like RCC1 family protein
MQSKTIYTQIYLIIVIVHMVFFHSLCFSQTIVAGGRHSLAICSDSTVQAWGYNGFGQLGNGNSIEQHSGIQVTGLKGVQHVAAGLFHSLFIKNDGTVWACGRNNHGNLGNGTNTSSLSPVQVLGVSDITQAAGGGEHSLFLKSNGTVWACGNNAAGQLGDGTTTNRNIPVQINNLSSIIQVAAGAEYSLFLKNDGTVWACGHNGYGQFGDGTNRSSRTPIQIPGLSNIIQISAGEWHSLFVKDDGTVWSSGRNQYGQLGNGTTMDRNVFGAVDLLTDIIQAEAGGIHSVFLKKNGTVWACGLNSGGNNNGQLGDGTSTDKNRPVPVISSWGNSPIVRVEATREHSLFLQSDGKLWAAGRNNYGQLGYGSFTTENSLTPVLSDNICQSIALSIVESIDNQQDLLLFPNPASGIIHIQSAKGISSIDIINMLGDKIFSQQIFSVSQTNIDLSKFPNGVYYIKTIYSDASYSTKIFINKN